MEVAANGVEIDMLFNIMCPLSSMQGMFVHVQVDCAGKLCM